jgi:2-hydroxy-4-carboxymuconate semialdehyde hemiacetal dehydrogenase
MLHVGIIGYGTVARDHALAIQDSPHAELVAVIDPHLRDAGSSAVALRRARVFESLEAALNAAPLDAAIIASPTELHAAQSRAAIAAGLHTLVEFPFYAPPEELEALADAARRTDRILTVAHTCRFVWSFARTKELIDSGSLGSCRLISYYRLMNRPVGIGPDGARRSWNDDALVHHAAHVLDLARYWLGDSVTLLGGVAPEESSGHRNCALLLRGPGGIPISIAVTYDASHEVTRGALTMEKGMIEIGGFADLRVNGRPVSDGRPSSHHAALRDAIGRQDADFFAAIVERRRPAVSFDDSRSLAAMVRAVLGPA